MKIEKSWNFFNNRKKNLRFLRSTGSDLDFGIPELIHFAKRLSSSSLLSLKSFWLEVLEADDSDFPDKFGLGNWDLDELFGYAKFEELAPESCWLRTLLTGRTCSEIEKKIVKLICGDFVWLMLESCMDTDFIIDFIIDFYLVKVSYKVHNKVGNESQ